VLGLKISHLAMSKYCPFTSDQRNPHVKADSATDFISHAHFLPRQKKNDFLGRGSKKKKKATAVGSHIGPLAI